MDTVRDILTAHGSGISRGGLLAWARLRGDPKMTDAQLDAALAELGDQVIDVQGFLYLREYAPASALKEADAEASSVAAAPPEAWPAASPASSWQPVAPAYEDAPPAPTASTGPEGWVAPDAGPLPADGWAEPDGGSPPDGGWTQPEAGWVAPPSSGSRRTMVVAAVFVGVFVLVSGVAAFLLRGGAGADDPFVPNDAPAEPTPTSGTVVDAFTIGLGDCLIVPSEDEFDEVRRLSCAEPHDGEVFFVDDYPGSDYPSGDELDSYVDARCLPAFEAFTGSDFDGQEVLDIGWFAPTAGSWDDGDHEVLCYLTPIDGSMTSQSYRGANP